MSALRPGTNWGSSLRRPDMPEGNWSATGRRGGMDQGVGGSSVRRATYRAETRQGKDRASRAYPSGIETGAREGATGAGTLRPVVMTTTAPTMIAAAASERAVSGSSASAHPRKSATAGLT